MLQRGSQGEAVVRLQRALNVALDKQPPMIPDGSFGALTEAAVMEFCQRMSLSITGTASDALQAMAVSIARSMGWQETPVPGDGLPAWMRLAEAERGQHEVAGPKANPRILGYIATFPYLQKVLDHGVPMSATDETAWCACFVQWCLIRAGQRPGPSARAEDWKGYGRALDQPRPGAIIVLFNEALSASTTASGWHVGFWTGAAAGGVRLLGGNQSNAVREADMPGEVRACRWPE